MQRMFGLAVTIAVNPSIKLASLEDIYFYGNIPIKTNYHWDKTRIDFITAHMNLWIDNPASCARIDGITCIDDLDDLKD